MDIEYMKIKTLLSIFSMTLLLSSCGDFGQGVLMGLSSMGTAPMGGYMPATMPVGNATYVPNTVSSVGYSSSLSGISSSSSSSSGRSCRVCYGTGKCRTCNGKHWYYDSSFGTGKKLICPNCSDGRCTSCGGSGKR